MTENTFIYKGKHNEAYYYFYDINGDETNVTTNVVAREVEKPDDKSLYYIRVEANAPIHHEKFKSSNLLNPTFVPVTRDIFTDYLSYLKSKKEGTYRVVIQAMKAKGVI